MKDIPGFEGRYAVTEDGQVWSHLKGGPGGHKGKFLKPALLGKMKGKRYWRVKLQNKFKISVSKLVHRLVAQTFIPNPENKLEINHKNGIKTDNRVGNLEWCSRKENAAHAVKSGFYKQKPRD